MMQEAENWYLKHRGSHFILIDPYGNQSDQTLSTSHVCEVLEFNRLLCSYWQTNRRPPTDYDKIAAWFNQSVGQEKLARIKNGTVVVLGPSPYFDTSSSPAPQLYYTTVQNTADHTSKKEQELTQILKLGLEADRRASASAGARKGTTSHQDRLGRCSSLRGMTELASYSTPTSVSSS